MMECEVRNRKELQKWAGFPSEDAEERERGEEGEGTECADPSVSLPYCAASKIH